MTEICPSTGIGEIVIARYLHYLYEINEQLTKLRGVGSFR